MIIAKRRSIFLSLLFFFMWVPMQCGAAPTPQQISIPGRETADWGFKPHSSFYLLPSDRNENPIMLTVTTEGTLVTPNKDGRLTLTKNEDTNVVEGGIFVYLDETTNKVTELRYGIVRNDVGISFIRISEISNGSILRTDEQ
jgi:hypothetical protein